MTHLISADAERLTLDGPPLPPGTVLAVLLSGRRVWTFRVPQAAAPETTAVLEVPWPPALSERLTGRSSVEVRSAGAVIAEAVVQFDSSDQEFALVEPGTGIPQVVNKWGRVARSFEGRDPSLLDDVFDEVERLMALVTDQAGL